MRKRKVPYTERGIKRLKCFRCGATPSQQWQICSDDNVYRGICTGCDIELNEVVLKFMGFQNWNEKLERYKDKMIRTYG
jgi:hypothetical protein